MGNGLEVMLDIQQDEYLPVWGETSETAWFLKKIGKRHSHSCSHSRSFSHTDDSSFEAGIKVQIHSQDEPPFIDQLGFGVAPGFQTFVSCQEQRVGVVLICDLKWIVICFDSCYLFSAGVSSCSMGELQVDPAKLGLLQSVQHQRLSNRLRDALPGGKLQLPYGAYAWWVTATITAALDIHLALAVLNQEYFTLMPQLL